MHRRFLLAATAAVALGAAFVQPVSAADFKGKTITMVIPFGVGGGSDVWGRFNAQLLQKHLPGAPGVVVKNQPGGGSISGANLFAATAKPDGLTILGTSGSTQFPYLLGESHVKFDYNDWIPILAAPTGGVAYISSKMGVTGLKDLDKVRGKKLHYASQGLTSAYLRSSAPMVKKGEAIALFSWGVLDKEGKFARDPNFPDLPHFEEAYQIVFGKKPEGIEWESMKAFLVAGFPGQKLLVLPKGTSADSVETYRQAVRDLVMDPEYLQKRDELIGEYDELTDKAGEDLYKAATTISPDARNWVRDYLSKNYDVKFTGQ